MSRWRWMIPILLLINSCRKGEEITPAFYQCNFSFSDSSSTNPNHIPYSVLLHHITSNGVVGITLSVYHPQQGVWMGASGKADLHNNIDIQSCNISRVGSTVKMFTATTVLKLAEEGKFHLDDKISDYLQGDVITKIENAKEATIRQLLQHSSGIYNYIQNLQFQTASLNDLIREWKPSDLLKYAYHQKAYFKPGQDVRYSNTGYILLGMLIEKIEGKPFYKVFEEKIIIPLGLNKTRFAATTPVPDGIVRGYVDMYSNLQVIETTYFSGWDYYTADGGLISNPYDLTVFFKALMNHQIINSNSLAQMLTFQTPNEIDSEFFPISYGLGIFKIETPKGIAYMHSGDAIGYYANMLYFPEDTTIVAYAVNSNYGKIDQQVSTKEAIEKIISVTKP
ncbi:MAG: beta-lactamase family protein [Bacteroidetes bacterium]|nr:class A beta-lactamase-related serine hydrolase [Bacteroidota bacterium]MBV6460130.1 D-aminopeptidase [Flavobacteriales bacterium]WKZ74001.1 MAG: serine hydrolase domain-containing protein [Vicingaceae bacterium]MCL4816480.1 beta-lactamase family protein [Flavobacteriales bacterium]NOG95443.1 beta-lactamase family protein [Bacteroidota bacterium]